LAAWVSAGVAFFTGAGAVDGLALVWARLAVPDEVISAADFFDFFAFEVFSFATAGAEVSDEVASALVFFDFLCFEVLSAWVSGLVCADAEDCSAGKLQTQRAQATRHWQRTVNLLHRIGRTSFTTLDAIRSTAAQLLGAAIPYSVRFGPLPTSNWLIL
jgi:hypothetical protein